MASMWMVRAERGGRLFDAFKEHSVVAIGWADVDRLDELKDREAIAKRVAEIWPDWHPQAVRMSAGQLHRFCNEMSIGDRVVTYDPGRRVYLVGTISGEYRFDQSVDPDDPNVRAVEWDGEVSRDLLTATSKNSLGSISTLFLVPDDAAQDLERALSTQQPSSDSSFEGDEAAELYVFKDIQEKAIETAKDRITRLDPYEMQELVAGLLRAMGYKTRVSPSGPDRGKDIVASPDGFGFEAPRIVVEVKHRNQAMGSQDIRSFLGGRHSDDKGLYVSTGGFTKDAYYEAERANIPITLMNLTDLVEAIAEHYELLDVETKQLFPLKRIYWPV